MRMESCDESYQIPLSREITAHLAYTLLTAAYVFSGLGNIDRISRPELSFFVY
jgi:hypothetical protein